jgi:hypothetical protein
MNDERQQIRSTLAWTAGIAGWVLFIAFMFALLIVRRSSRNEIAALKSRLVTLEPELSAKTQLAEEKTTALDLAEDRLSRFVAQAARQFPDSAPDVRLGMLHEFIVAKHLWASRRFLDPASFNRIRPLLKDAPALEVEIGAMQNDIEALALAREIRTLFDSTGMNVRKLAEYTDPPNNLHGVSIYSKRRFDDSLGTIVPEIFAAVRQEKIEWVDETPDANARDPDMKIFVGPK